MKYKEKILKTSAQYATLNASRAFSLNGFGCLLFACVFLFGVFFNHKSVAEELLAAGPAFQHKERLNNFALGGIAQLIYSQRGYIWIGSKNGLIRYDGNASKLYRHQKNNPHSLSSNDIWGLSEDPQGNIWICTYGGGVNKYNPRTESFARFDQSNGLPTNIAFTVYADKDSNVWVGTSQGLSLISSDTNQVSDFAWQEEINSAVWSIFADRDGRLWIGTSNGAFLVQDNRVVQRFTHQADRPDSISNDVIRTMYQDDKGQIWFGTDNGLNVLNEQQGTFTRYLHNADDSSSISGNEVYSVLQYQDDLLWVGTFGKGLNLLDTRSGKFKRLNIETMPKGFYPETSAYSLIMDRSGTLWMGSDNGLVNLRLSGMAFKHQVFKDATGARIIDFTDRDASVFGISETTLFQLENQQTHVVGAFDQYSPLTSMERSGDDFWLGTFRNGLLGFDKSTQAVTRFTGDNQDPASLPSNSVSALLVDNDNTLWVGTFRDSVDSQAGVARYNANTHGFERFLPGMSVTGLLDIGPRQLLVGTYYNGLFLLDKISGQSEVVALGEDNSARSQIRGLYKDILGRVWVTTQSAGIAEYSVADKSVSFIDDPAQLAAAVRGVASDKNGHLWLTTEEGVLKKHAQTHAIEMFDNTDGLLLKNFQGEAVARDPSGALLFGGVGGFLHFDPDDIEPEAYSPEVVINELRLLNNPVQVGELLPVAIDYASDLTLDYQDYFFSLSFSALDYSAPQKNRYAYRLVGLDDDWIYTSAANRVATYTSLSPGDYTFLVKASNSKGQWSDNQSRLNITILPPWWRTWIAYFIYAIAAVLLPIYVIQVRTRSLKQRANELAQGIKDRTLELEEKNDTISTLLEQKKRMFVNISHEFRTPLTLILSPVEQLLQRFKSGDDRDTLLMVKKNGKRLLEMVEQLLVLAKLESSPNPHLQLYSVRQAAEQIVKSFEPLLLVKHQTLHMADLDDAVVQMQSDALEHILSNVISNAIKYTPEYGQITVASCRMDKKVIITVKDSGIGISPQHHENVFERFHRGTNDHNELIPGAGIGLALVKELVDQHHGAVTLDSELGKGSTFTIFLPVYTSDYDGAHIVDVESETKYSVSLAPGAPEPDIESDEPKPLLLIIEDNADLRKHLDGLLRSRYRIIEANDGVEGLELARARVPDIIICDLMMPNMSGFETSRQIKNDPILSHIPILVLTAKTDDESRVSGFKEHVDDYMTKPFSAEELLLRLDNLLVIRRILRSRFAEEMRFNPAGMNQLKSELNPQDRTFVTKFESLVEHNFSDNDFQLQMAAQAMNLSDRQLQRKLRAITGLSFSDYLRNCRLNKARELLLQGLAVYLVQEAVGFQSPSYFSKCFKAEFGQTPKQFQQEGVEEQRQGRSKARET